MQMLDSRFKPVGYKRCNLCGFQPTVTLIRGNKKIHCPQHKVVYRGCPKCSMVSMDMDYNQIDSFYERCDHAKINDYHFQEITETWETLRYIAQHEKSVLEGKGKSFYDVGCGAAGSLATFQSLGYQVAGAELNLGLVEFAKERKFKVDNLAYNREVLSPNSVDFIYCYNAMEHLARPFMAITTMRYHLKTGGILYLEVPHAYDASVYKFGFGHISMFTPDNLAQSIRNAGFGIIAMIDRSESSIYGVGILARKHIPDERLIEEFDKSFPSKNNYFKLFPLAIRLNYGFFIERPRSLYTIEVLYRFLFLFPFYILKLLVKKIVHIRKKL